VAGRTSRSARIAALAIAGALTGSGCGSYAAGARFSDPFPTQEAAAEAVLAALWTRDADRLLGLALSEREFRTIVWPQLPASRPEMGMPFDYLWGDMSRKSRTGIAEALAEHGRQRRRLQAVRFSGAPVDYGPFRIYPKTTLLVTGDEGRTDAIRVFGSMIEADGRWKIYSFVVD
jgi:hypothetical protein